MNKRISVFFNFFAFNLLFFALYLNFIYKDVAAAVPTMQMAPVEVKSTSESNYTKPVEKEKTADQKTPSSSVSEKSSKALHLSMN